MLCFHKMKQRKVTGSKNITCLINWVQCVWRKKRHKNTCNISIHFIFSSSSLLLQMQLKQAIKLGSPPSLMCVKRMEDGGAVSEDDGLPCSPPEYAAARHAAAVRTLESSGKAGGRSTSRKLQPPVCHCVCFHRLRGAAASVWREPTVMTTRWRDIKQSEKV